MFVGKLRSNVRFDSPEIGEADYPDETPNVKRYFKGILHFWTQHKMNLILAFEKRP